MNLRNTLHLVAVLATLIFGNASVSAQTMKPGLWEAHNNVGGSPEMDQAMAKMQQQMAAMPPAQRKMMEDMLAKQGVGMGGAGTGGSMVLKMCITKEMAERNQLPVQQQGNCTTTTTDKSSKGMKMKFTCTNPPSSGEGQFTFAGDTAYTMKMKVNNTSQGVPKTTTVDTSARWLAADCGAIKPMVMPK
ncbi:MAG: DUF3617 domain-containing protein [Pseudomonadota bacterium]